MLQDSWQERARRGHASTTPQQLGRAMHACFLLSSCLGLLHGPPAGVPPPMSADPTCLCTTAHAPYAHAQLGVLGKRVQISPDTFDEAWPHGPQQMLVS